MCIKSAIQAPGIVRRVADLANIDTIVTGSALHIDSSPAGLLLFDEISHDSTSVRYPFDWAHSGEMTPLLVDLHD